MNSRIKEALALKHSPVAILLTNTKPEKALQFKEGKWGCAAAMLRSAAKGRAGVFDRKTSGSLSPYRTHVSRNGVERRRQLSVYARRAEASRAMADVVCAAAR